MTAALSLYEPTHLELFAVCILAACLMHAALYLLAKL